VCGIAGILNSRAAEPVRLVSEMIRAMRTRGPDDSGTWTEAADGLGLGHVRLSILDLSPNGHQPMLSGSGRYVISYNGEVYNFADVRSELESHGVRFYGHSDTEVMLAAIERWGLQEAVSRFVGMFAFGLWDRETRQLSLVRDRLGIKPLYFGWAGRAFVFASELKGIRCVREFDPQLHRGALALFLRLAYVPAPFSIFQHVYKLMPGCIFTVTPELALTKEGFSPSPDDDQATWKPMRYWSAREVAERGVATPFHGTEVEAEEHLDALLRQAIRLRMIADVPLGAFLSGGIDSSVVVALMQAQSSVPVKTFSIGFQEAGYNEAGYAKDVAKYLGTDHTELYVAPEKARAVIPMLPTMYDEPFGDSSQIPTFLVSELARKHVTVALSGDGGDELFGGYNRYFWSRRLWRRLAPIPQPVRAGLGSMIQAMSPDRWGNLYSRLSFMLPAVQRPGDQMHKLASLLGAKDPDAMYQGMVSLWQQPTETVVGTAEPQTTLTDRSSWAQLSEFAMRMMYLDLVTYLPDDILTKVDRASMAVSLEARVPLLDHRVVEFAWSLPLSMKIKSEGEGKWVLRRVLDRYVSRELIDRPKMGFGIPLDTWLRGPLREWAETLLDDQRLRREGHFHPGPIRQRWAEHLSGKRNWQYALWNVLMFQAWNER
jgi:asparagine synthase (glutamine-hydrolysing)